ncbi:hypothetical protein BKA67DRAFT_543961 [Truncatella angustata]|uniref:Uncharacterized protein n=1 Tax=Truncatella angustata TaxID=152316 RepID=A0A9P8UW24_9PEZI|nr:uncharacterized protein BKA67DRAFT_543961 [Truncatella angustata]KAH6659257.1 hypothetical protein BKA67DRAFT_543961 [Truncatella angustata]
MIPFVYIGLGTYIVVKSDCYPWTIQQIVDSTTPGSGRGIMAGITIFLLLACTCFMTSHTLSKIKTHSITEVELSFPENASVPSDTMDHGTNMGS